MPCSASALLQATSLSSQIICSIHFLISSKERVLYWNTNTAQLLCICSLKIMAGPAPHTQLDADLAAGMGMPDNGPKLMSM